MGKNRKILAKFWLVLLCFVLSYLPSLAFLNNVSCLLLSGLVMSSFLVSSLCLCHCLNLSLCLPPCLSLCLRFGLCRCLLSVSLVFCPCLSFSLTLSLCLFVMSFMYFVILLGLCFCPFVFCSY